MTATTSPSAIDIDTEWIDTLSETQQEQVQAFTETAAAQPNRYYDAATGLVLVLVGERPVAQYMQRLSHDTYTEWLDQNPVVNVVKETDLAYQIQSARHPGAEQEWTVEVNFARDDETVKAVPTVWTSSDRSIAERRGEAYEYPTVAIRDFINRDAKRTREDYQTFLDTHEAISIVDVVCATLAWYTPPLTGDGIRQASDDGRRLIRIVDAVATRDEWQALQQVVSTYFVESAIQFGIPPYEAELVFGELRTGTKA